MVRTHGCCATEKPIPGHIVHLSNLLSLAWRVACTRSRNVRFTVGACLAYTWKLHIEMSLGWNHTTAVAIIVKYDLSVLLASWWLGGGNDWSLGINSQMTKDVCDCSNHSPRMRFALSYEATHELDNSPSTVGTPRLSKKTETVRILSKIISSLLNFCLLCRSNKMNGI